MSGKRRKQSPFLGRRPDAVAYSTAYGRLFHGHSDELLGTAAFKRFFGKVNLIFTSPPFPLNRKKKYGNEQGQRYIEWLCEFGPLFKKLLAPDGSIVIEMGNSWEPGSPVMSTLGMRALLEFQAQNELHLCQEFIWANPARLPAPAQWVTVDRIRVKDSFTRLWWMAKTTKPKADNRRVLVPYSSSMRKLLKRRTYNSGIRPSEYVINETSFLKDNGGAIPASVLTFNNTHSSDEYFKYCRQHNLTLHPARMPIDLADFFIRLLTKPGDLVLDPFAGSNTTGFAAQKNERYWIGIEAMEQYIRGSLGRFPDAKIANLEET